MGALFTSRDAFAVEDMHLASGSTVHVLSRPENGRFRSFSMYFRWILGRRTPSHEREAWIRQHLKISGRSDFSRITVVQHQGESTSKWEMMKLPHPRG